MTVALNEDLLRKFRRPRNGGLTNEDCIALNLFWRKKVDVLILAKVFHLSKNTIYIRAITGPAESYPNPNSAYSNSAAEVNALIDKLGVEKAWNRYVTDDMVEAVEAEMKAELERRESALVE